MKFIAPLLFLTCFAQAQTPYVNDDRVYPILGDILLQTTVRGVDLQESLNEIDSIIVTNRGINEYRWVGNISTIEIDEKEFQEQWRIERIIAHEVGHNKGADDCGQCTLSFMAGIIWSNKETLDQYTDPNNRHRFYDHFAEVMKDPAAHNDPKTHKHY